MPQGELKRPLRVCYFGTYRAEYSRNQIMIKGLRCRGVEVVECHEQLWHGIGDRVQVASGGWLKLGFMVRVFRTYWHLLRRYSQVGDYDVMVLGYPGQPDVCLARVLTWLKRKLLVLDVFMSLYLIASERGLAERHRFTARLVFELEKIACSLPDMLILDTEEYVRWFQRVYGLDPCRFRLVPTGADDQLFHPVDASEHRDRTFRVLYYGTFIPNHGVEYIVAAANLLKEDPMIRFELVGEGPSKSYAVDMVEKQGLTNVSFTSWIDKHELPRRIAEADVCLGAFGTTPQSMMTVQNKIYEGLAMGKPVITGDAPLMRSVFAHGEHLYLCDRSDPQALADAILVLRDDESLREHMAESGHRVFETSYTIGRTGEALVRYLYEAMER